MEKFQIIENIYNIPCIPVDTHVVRVTNRLGIVENETDPFKIELRLMEKIPQDKWNRVGEQILLFGRYTCKSVNPMCDGCLFKAQCKRENLK